MATVHDVAIFYLISQPFSIPQNAVIVTAARAPLLMDNVFINSTESTQHIISNHVWLWKMRQIYWEMWYQEAPQGPSFLSITKPTIHSLACRGSVKHISGLIYKDTRGVLKVFLKNVIVTPSHTLSTLIVRLAPHRMLSTP